MQVNRKVFNDSSHAKRSAPSPELLIKSNWWMSDPQRATLIPVLTKLGALMCVCVHVWDVGIWVHHKVCSVLKQTCLNMSSYKQKWPQVNNNWIGWCECSSMTSPCAVWWIKANLRWVACHQFATVCVITRSLCCCSLCFNAQIA